MQRGPGCNGLPAILAAADLRRRIMKRIQLFHTPAQFLNILIHISSHITSKNNGTVKKQPNGINGPGKIIQISIPQGYCLFFFTLQMDKKILQIIPVLAI